METTRKLPFKPRLTRGDRRQVIEDAASRLFAERGYDGTPLDAIASAAGVTRAVLYDHFSSKGDLHGALLRAETNRLLEHVAGRVLEAPDDMRLRLQAGVEGFFAFVETHPFAWRMIFRDPPSDPRVAAVHREIQEQATRAIAVMLADGARQVGLPVSAEEPRLRAFAEMLKVAQNSLAAMWWDDRSLRREQLVEWVMAFSWDGLPRALTEATD